MSVADEGLNPRQIAARDGLHDFLQANSREFGPWDEDTGETIPEQVWVVVVAWTDESGGSWLTRMPSRGLPGYQRNGLLHEGLYGFED